MKKDKTEKTPKKTHWSDYKDTFRSFDRRYFYSVLFDGLFVVSLMVFSFISQFFVFDILKDTEIFGKQVVTLEGLGDVATTSMSQGLLLTKVLVIFVLFISLSFITWGLTRNAIWTVWMKKRWSTKTAFKFTWSLFLWQFVCALPLVVVLLLVTLLLGESIFTNNIAGFTHIFFICLVTICYSYFTTVFYYKSVQSGGRITSIWDSIKSGVQNIKVLIWPVLFVIVTFVVIAVVSMIYSKLPSIYVNILSGVSWLLFISWIRKCYLQTFERHKI